MLVAQKASLNSLFHPNLLGSGSQVTLLQGKLFSSDWMNLKSQGWDHFIHLTSPYLVAYSTERGKPKHWTGLKVNARANSHFPILAALYSWSFLSNPVSPVPSPVLLLFSIHSSLISASLGFFFFSFLFFFLPCARFPQQNTTDRW